MSERIGIGVVTFNRLNALQECLKAIHTHTRSPFDLVVADDGSTDGTVVWLRDQGFAVVGGANRGVAWNKNRALYHLLSRSECDVILLLEDDCWPAESGWEQNWVDAGRVWGHVNFVPNVPELIRSGSGSGVDPFWTTGFLAQCSATSRGVLQVVGYLDPRFEGWGWEHIEHTWRCTDLLRSAWGARPGPWPCLCSGVVTPPCGTWTDHEAAARNHALFEAIRRDEIGPDRALWRAPWASAMQREEFLSEQEASTTVEAGMSALDHSPGWTTEESLAPLRNAPEPYRSTALLPFDGHGWFGAENATRLKELIDRHRVTTAVELGCWLGSSTRWIAGLLPEDGRLYAVDTWQGSLEMENLPDCIERVPRLYQQFLSNVVHAGLEHRIIPIRMTTTEAARALAVRPDLVYVDASHEEEDVYADVLAWHAKLAPGGVICGDDWTWRVEVNRAITRAATELGKQIHADANFWWLE